MDYRSIFIGLVCLTSSAFAATPLQSVDKVDLSRYLGVWYEIASFPGPHQENCVASRATYSLRPDGDIAIKNECREKTFDGKAREATGKAWVVDKNSNAKLKVRFFWPFKGDYWVIDLGKDYEFAVVSEPKRKYLWILSRKPHLEETVYKEILDRLTKNEFDLSRLNKTPQPPSGN